MAGRIPRAQQDLFEPGVSAREKYARLIADLGLTPETMAQEYSQPIRVTITRKVNV